MIKNLKQLSSLIPAKWKDVPIVVGNGIGGWKNIKQVSLHENTDGSRVILIHESVAEIPKPETST